MTRKKPVRKPRKSAQKTEIRENPYLPTMRKDFAQAEKWAQFASALNWALLLFVLLILALGGFGLYVEVSLGGAMKGGLSLSFLTVFVFEIFIFWYAARGLKKYAQYARQFAQRGDSTSRDAAFTLTAHLLRLSVLATALLIIALFFMLLNGPMEKA